ncbi:DUF6380 family protein [Streptomyces sp. NPDC048275]
MGQSDSIGEKRQATFRSPVASLTAMACSAPFDHCGRASGEGAR